MTYFKRNLDEKTTSSNQNVVSAHFSVKKEKSTRKNAKFNGLLRKTHPRIY